MIFAKIYVGCECGETWHVALSDEDEDAYCTICGGNNLKEKLVNGSPVTHLLSDDEAKNEHKFQPY